jgi:hypothetical protein
VDKRAHEKGQIAGTVGPFLQRRMQERKVPLFLKPFASKFDKATRAQSIRGYMSLSGLYVNTKASYYAAFVEELLAFPAARHDDQVDALGLIGQLLDVLQPGQAIKAAAAKFDPYARAYRRITDEAMLDRVMHDNEYNLHALDEDAERRASFMTL